MIRTPLLCCSLALACTAEDPAPSRELNLNAHLTGTSFLGDLGTERSTRPALGLALEATFHVLSRPDALRLRWDIPRTTTVRGESCFTQGYREDRDFRTSTLGLDYLWSFQPHAQNGFFVSGGLALQSTRANYKGIETGGSFSADRTYDSTHLGLTAGLGYRFKHLVLELKGMSAGFRGREASVQNGHVTGWGDADKRGTAMQFSVAWR